MSKSVSNRRRAIPAEPSPFQQARDELFQHIMRCDVIGSHVDDQKAWFDETMSYMGERYYELSAAELRDLRQLGERFAQPARPQTPVPPLDTVSA